MENFKSKEDNQKTTFGVSFYREGNILTVSLRINEGRKLNFPIEIKEDDRGKSDIEIFLNFLIKRDESLKNKPVGEFISNDLPRLLQELLESFSKNDHKG